MNYIKIGSGVVLLFLGGSLLLYETINFIYFSFQGHFSKIAKFYLSGVIFDSLVLTIGYLLFKSGRKKLALSKIDATHDMTE